MDFQYFHVYISMRKILEMLKIYNISFPQLFIKFPYYQFKPNTLV